MTNQEILDKFTLHCAAQGEPSMNEKGQCLYRGPGGRMCGVGLFLTDEEVEANGFDKGDVSARTVCSKIDRLSPFAYIMSAIQTAHDMTDSPEALRSYIISVAKELELEATHVDKITRWHVDTPIPT